MRPTPTYSLTGFKFKETNAYNNTKNNGAATAESEAAMLTIWTTIIGLCTLCSIYKHWKFADIQSSPEFIHKMWKTDFTVEQMNY